MTDGVCRAPANGVFKGRAMAIDLSPGNINVCYAGARTVMYRHPVYYWYV